MPTPKSEPRAVVPQSKPTQSARRSPSKSLSTPAPAASRLTGRVESAQPADILGAALATTGLLSLLAVVFPQEAGFTAWLSRVLHQAVGAGAILLPLSVLFIGVRCSLRKLSRLPSLSIVRLAGGVCLSLNALGWIHLVLGGGWALAQSGMGGGYLGAFSEVLLAGALGEIGAGVALLAWTTLALALTLDISVSDLLRLQTRLRLAHARAEAREITNGLVPPPAQLAPSTAGPKHHPSGFARPAAAPSLSAPAAQTEPRKILPAARPTASPTAVSQVQADPAPAPTRPATARSAEPPVKPGRRKAQPGILWRLPQIDEVLDPPAPESLLPPVDDGRSDLIEQTLASFTTPVRVVEIHRGPTVTQFCVEPLYVENRAGQTRVRVSRIAALADDLALALAAPRIRIQAPVPGRHYVGIEVPNAEISRVALRDVLESEPFRKIKSPLRFALGKDVAGHSKAYDLASMPHLLIAGTTGSGKSVCVNSILASLLLNNTPNELRMILVDPKRVELTGYNGVPHLLAPVIVEADEVVGALQWVIREMEGRYERFAQIGARNIADYNAREETPLPYMLVLVDELADLMMLAPDETERSLTRLAQLARATGIHLVLATQRPSVDVVTGLIKANFPARIAFAVASGMDSRVILDQSGAEKLLGRGDMLFQAPDAAAPARIQGVFVSDAEIQDLVAYWRQQAYEMRDLNLRPATVTPIQMEPAPETPLRRGGVFADDPDRGDQLAEEAIKILRAEGKGSVSLLQRKMRIGYTRAARLIDELEARGVVGPSIAGNQFREVLAGEENSSPAEH